MIKHIFLITMLLLSITFSIFIPKTYAIMGVGDIVHDPASFALQQEQYLENIRSAIYTYYSWENSVRQLYYAIENIQNIDSKISKRGIAGVLESIDSLQSIIYGIRGIGYSFQNTQYQFDQIYPSFQKLYKMSGTDYAYEAEKVMQQTSDALYDAMRAQGLISEIADDQTYLKTLLETSQSSGGALAAIQVSNQLLGSVIQQLTRLQTIIATSARAETSYLAQISSESVVGFKSDSHKIEAENTLNSSGNGPGITNFK